MSNVSLVDYEEITDPSVRSIYDNIRVELGFGMVPNLFRSMATNPPLLANYWQQFNTTILQGQLPRILKEMIGVVISQKNESPYALQVHLHSLSALGISEMVLTQLVQDFENCPLPTRQKRAIQFGLLCATAPQTLAAHHFDQLRSDGLTDSEILEIMGTANLFLAINHYTDAISLEIDQL